MIERDIELPFEYSDKIIKYLVVVVIIIIVVFIFDRFFKDRIIKIIRKPNIPKLKTKYTKRLMILHNKVQDNKIDIRNAYIELSNIVREFVERTTGIKASSFSKSDADKLGIKDLSILMEEFYPPEFSKQASGNILKSIKKSMEVINKWNQKSQ